MFDEEESLQFCSPSFGCVTFHLFLPPNVRKDVVRSWDSTQVRDEDVLLSEMKLEVTFVVLKHMENIQNTIWNFFKRCFNMLNTKFLKVLVRYAIFLFCLHFRWRQFHGCQWGPMLLIWLMNGLIFSPTSSSVHFPLFPSTFFHTVACVCVCVIFWIHWK